MTDTFRILVTGSRDWDDWRTITGALIQARRDGNPDAVPTVVHGCARGADFLAAQAARKLGWDVEDHPARWDQFGKVAGFRRNQAMVALGADICLVFRQRGAGNRGTSHCAELAGKAGIPLREFWSEQNVSSPFVG